MNNFNWKNNTIIGVVLAVSLSGFAVHLAFAELSTMSMDVKVPTAIVSPITSTLNTVAAPVASRATAPAVVVAATTSPAETKIPTSTVAPETVSKETDVVENDAKKNASERDVLTDTKIEKIASPAPRSLQSRITVKDKGKVSGNTEVLVKVEEKAKVATVEVSLARDNGGAPLYLGKAQIDPSNTQGVLPWNSANTPDGSYKLSTVITTQDGVVTKGDTVAVVVKNEKKDEAMLDNAIGEKTRGTVRQVVSEKITEHNPVAERFAIEKPTAEKFVEDIKTARTVKEEQIKKELAGTVKILAESKESKKSIPGEILPVSTNVPSKRALPEASSAEFKKIVDGKVEELMVAIRESDVEKKQQLTEELAGLAQAPDDRGSTARNGTAGGAPQDISSVPIKSILTKNVEAGVAKLEQVAIEQQSGIVDVKNFAVEAVQVAEVATKTDGTKTASKISFKGKALPNSFATLYIYSIPIVVTVKTDNDGNWNYTLDKELEDGKHQVFVAITDVKGVVVAKSNPLPFVKEASAITVEQIVPQAGVSPSFVDDNYFYGSIAFVILAVIAIFFLLGIKMRNTPQ